MSEPQQSVEVPVEVFNALFSASSTLASAAASLVTSEREGRIVLRATQPIIKRAVELMERDMHAANAAAREEGRLAGYADGLADGRREAPAVPPPLVPAHHQLASALLGPVTAVVKHPKGEKLVGAAFIAICVLLIAAGCASAAAVGLPIPDLFGVSHVP